MNQMKTRLQSLGLLDRAIRSMSDEELDAVVAELGDDHREALERLTGGTDAGAIRAAATRGRIDGAMESIAMLLTDACLADCIKELGDHADHPSSDELRAVLPGVIERHGLGITRTMLASTVAGEASAANVIRDLLKHDELVKLPPAEPRPVAPTRVEDAVAGTDADREAIRARRQELKQRKQAEARARREQAARARGRA